VLKEGQHYYYYHCTLACGFSHNSEIVNELFEEELSKFSLFQHLQKNKNYNYEKFFKCFKRLDDERKILTKQVIELNKKIEKARDLYLEDKLDEEDFRSY
jgi:hypothetical protein